MPGLHGHYTNRSRAKNSRPPRLGKVAPHQSRGGVTEGTAWDHSLARLPQGGDFSPATFERHAALLGDSRLLHPMYAHQHVTILRQLQRDYGNQYVRRLLDHVSRRQAHGRADVEQPSDAIQSRPSSEAKVVQRDVGFEFELGGVATYKKGRFGGTETLSKKDVILTGQGFKVEADEMPRYSDMEFVTNAFPETPEGGESLKKALEGISGVITSLSDKGDQEVPASELSAFGTPKSNRFLKPNRREFPLKGKPQATVGIKLKALDKFFEDIEYREQGQPGWNDQARVIFGGQVGQYTGRPLVEGGSGVLPVAQARTATDTVLVKYNEIVRKANPDNPVIGGPELRALVTQLALYLVRGAKGVPGYGKTIAGEFMFRTNFATVYKQLPQEQQEYFREFPETFVNLVLEAAAGAAKAANVKVNMSAWGKVFEGGLYTEPGMYGGTKQFQADLLPQLKRQDWLMGIVKGTDLLTAANYPGGKKEKEEIESLGSYGEAMDKLGIFQEPAPIMEFRGLKEIYAELFTPLALDLFRYVHTINTAGLEGYPGQLPSLSQDEIAALVSGQPTSDGRTAAQIRKEIVDKAMKEIERWI